MNYRITHITEYLYAGMVDLCYNQLKIKPRDTNDQECLSHNLLIEPTTDSITERTDFYGNKTHYFSIEKSHRYLKIKSVSLVKKKTTSVQARSAQSITWEAAANLVDTLQKEDYLEARQFLYPSPHIPRVREFRQYAENSFYPDRDLFEAVEDLCRRIYTEFTFTPGYTDVNTPVERVLMEKKGVCQDFAHLAIACVRAMGIPARYVSGYIETIPPPGKEKLAGADASHAWISVFIPDSGWVDFDPTNNLLAGIRHITTGWGRDYSDLAPVKGIIFSSGVQKMNISVDVELIK